MPKHNRKTSTVGDADEQLPQQNAYNLAAHIFNTSENCLTRALSKPRLEPFACWSQRQDLPNFEGLGLRLASAPGGLNFDISILLSMT